MVVVFEQGLLSNAPTLLLQVFCIGLEYVWVGFSDFVVSSGTFHNKERAERSPKPRATIQFCRQSNSRMKPKPDQPRIRDTYFNSFTDSTSTTISQQTRKSLETCLTHNILSYGKKCTENHKGLLNPKTLILNLTPRKPSTKP